MSRRVMKPLFSMSHIWKNSRVFSWTVLRPTSLVSEVSDTSLSPLLCHEVPTNELLASLAAARESAEAAMASASVSLWVFPSVLHMSRVQLSCGAYRYWRIPGCSTSEPLSTVTDSHLLATTYVISRWNKERDSRRGFLIKSSPRKRVVFFMFVKHMSRWKVRLVFYNADIIVQP